MLILLTSPWPSLIVGVICLLWGIGFIGLTPKEWLLYLISLPFILIPDDTKTEKAQLESQTAEEVAAANPGCALILVGLILITFGLFRLLA